MFIIDYFTVDALPNRDGDDNGGTADLETKLEDDMSQETGAASTEGRDIIQGQLVCKCLQETYEFDWLFSNTATENHPQHFFEQVVQPSEKNDAITVHVVRGMTL